MNNLNYQAQISEQISPKILSFMNDLDLEIINSQYIDDNNYSDSTCVQI